MSSPSDPTIKSMRLLGWESVRDALAQRIYAPLTRELCHALQPETDFTAARAALAETMELHALTETQMTHLPIGYFADLRAALDEIAKHGIMEPKQGLEIMGLLQLARDVRGFFAARREPSGLRERALLLAALPACIDTLKRCLDEDGEIRDNASPELKQAIKASRAAREDLEANLGKLLRAPAYQDIVQESYFTEREGRLVLPVRADRKAHVDGIVHGASGSGATLYVEPAPIVPLNNRLRIAQGKVQQEKANILRMLAAMATENEAELRRNMNILAHFDLLNAKVRLARDMRAGAFEFTAGQQVRLLQARNPELILGGRDVIPNDIHWPEDARVIMISGPNTGGKTVTLKTIGLMALMARAGLLLPVAGNSTLGFFPRICADIGDEQSIGENLSTFSAHLGKIVSIMGQAAPGSLIILDELGIATDPEQGAALAEAILLRLKEQGATTLVSTHYLSLKILAQTEPGFLNASAEFDEKTQRPTYRLMFGAPGASAAIATAERLGLAGDVVARAKAVYQRRDTRADALLNELARQKEEMERERRRLAEELDAARRLKEEQETLTAQLREEERRLQTETSRLVQNAAREARLEIRSLLQSIKGSRDPQAVRKAEKRVETLAHAHQPAPVADTSGWDVPAEQLREGDTVMVSAYGSKGVLLENPAGKKKVRIRLGQMETVLDAQQLRGHARQSAPPPDARPAAVTVHADTHTQAQLSCNLQGLRAEEAKSKLEAFIDQALANKLGRVTIIHGHGMGAIKRLVRDYLESCGFARSFTPGRREEGGDGVTIVEF